MERDFMGLNSKDSLIVVKEEVVEGSKDFGFAKTSGVPWPVSSNKVSALPHFMSYKASQDEKVPKVMADHLASGFLVTSGELQNVHSMHLYPDAKMLPMSMSNPFLKTHFAGAGQNFAGPTSKQQFVGGVPVAAARSVLHLSSFVAGTTESRFNSKAAGAPSQLTIFYNGTVNVFDDITPEKAQAIMFLAGNVVIGHNMAQPRVPVQSPPTKLAPGDAAFGNQTITTPPSSALSSPISVSSHPIVQPGGGPANNDEVKAPKTTGISTNLVNKVESPQMVTSVGPGTATTMIPSAVPQFRKASLARFLEKRKERVMNSAPYNLSKKPGGSIPDSNATSIAASGSMSTSKDSP